MSTFSAFRLEYKEKASMDEDIGPFSTKFTRDEISREIAATLGIQGPPDALWHKYVFDQKFAQHRNSPMMSNNKIHTLLSLLVQQVLTPVERQQVYPESSTSETAGRFREIA